jgi:hypothetical protein
MENEEEYEKVKKEYEWVLKQLHLEEMRAVIAKYNDSHKGYWTREGVTDGA